MRRLLAASVMLALAATLPALAGSPPPKFDIQIVNRTGYPLVAKFYNGDDKVMVFSANDVQVPSGQSVTGSCNSTGGCNIRACLSTLQTRAGNEFTDPDFIRCNQSSSDVVMAVSQVWNSSCLAFGAYTGGGKVPWGFC